MAGPRGPSPVTDALPPGSSRPCLDRRGWMTDSEECTGWPRGCIWRVSSPSCPQSCCKMGANVHAWTARTYTGLLTGSVGSGHVLRRCRLVSHILFPVFHWCFLGTTQKNESKDAWCCPVSTLAHSQKERQRALWLVVLVKNQEVWWFSHSARSQSPPQLCTASASPVHLRWSLHVERPYPISGVLPS